MWILEIEQAGKERREVSAHSLFSKEARFEDLPSHGGRRLDQYVCVLTSDPRVVEEVVQPASEASERLLEESRREHL